MKNITLHGQRDCYRFYPYDQRNLLGEGGMGRVFKGLDSTGNPVAIKAIFAELVRNPSIKERSEIEAHCRFQHPHLIEMMDYCVNEKGRVHIISRFVDGVSFPKYLKTISVSQSEKRNLLIHHSQSILDALDFLHAHQVIHRDVKPENIMMTHEQKAVLMDLGVARTSNGKRLTKAGVIIGTPHYSAPEQIRGEGDRINATTDVYAAGITLYELLTGQLPFDGKSEYDIMEMHINRNLPEHPDLPPEIYRVLKKATEKDQGNRFQSAKEFNHSLSNSFIKRSWWQRLLSAIDLK